MKHLEYKIITLGCKVNQFETQALETMLRGRGHSPSSASAPELVVVNTCAVTSESGRKSRQAIRKLRSEHPHAFIAVCGCFSQLSPSEAAELGADLVHGSGSKERFLEDIEAALDRGKGERIETWTDKPFERRVFEELPAGAVSGRTRAFLKIQDGCENFCSYCIVPYARGRVRSLPPERCAAQAEKLSRAGFREIVITGIEIASYGRDLGSGPKLSLIDAVEALAGGAGEARLRLGSLEPTVVTGEFCRRLAVTGKVCDHFHLSLQSGCDTVLHRMNRKYNTEVFFKSTELLREYFPGCAITADLIAGFPGETEDEWAQTMSFIEKCNFSAMHIFPYSARPGTRAAEMEGQIKNFDKARRAGEAGEKAAEMEESYLRTCIGKTFPVLFESERGGMSIGHAPNYAKVCTESAQLRGLVENVEIRGLRNKMLVGKLL